MGLQQGLAASRARKPPRVHSPMCRNFLLLTTLAAAGSREKLRRLFTAVRTQKQSTGRVAGPNSECDDNVKEPFRCLQLFPGPWDPEDLVH